MKTMIRLIFLLLLTLLGPPAEGGMVIPLSLRQMTSQAGKIFVGRCLQISSDLDEQGIPSTLVRFQVIEALKGVDSSEETVLIKQFGTSKPRLPTEEGEKVLVPLRLPSQAMIATEPGEETLLFLYPESSYGFTSAVGLGQGKFLIDRRKAGPPQALPALSIQERSYNLPDLVQEVKQILSEEGSP